MQWNIERASVSKDVTCGPCEEETYASHWLFAQTTLVDIATWNFACGVESGNQLYFFKLQEIRLMGLRSCGGSKIALYIDKTHGLYNS